MKISQVKIQNFKILEDIDISFNGGLTFLNANNGCGKTTFQEAIKWCLYGDAGPNKDEPLASKLASDDVREVSVSVQIVVESPESDERIEITRSVLWDVAANRESSKEAGGQLRLRIAGLKNPKPTQVPDNPRVWIEKNFPSSLLSYFLFDGEIMWKFFEPDVKSRMGAAIKSIARVGAVDELEIQFSQAAAKFRREAAKEAGPDVIALNQIREKASAELHRLQKIELPEAENTIQQWESIKTEASKVLSRFDDAKALIRSIEDFEGEDGSLAREKNRIKSLNDEFVVDFLKRPQLAFKSAFSEIPQLVDRAKKEGWYPLPFSVSALEELIDAQNCICGNHLKPGSNAEQEVLKIISSRKEMGEKGVELGALAAGVQEIIGENSEAITGIHQKDKKIVEARGDYELLEEAHQAKIDELGKLSLPDAKEAQKKYDDSVVALKVAMEKQQTISDDIAITQRQVDDAQAKLDEAQDQSDNEVRLNHLAAQAEKFAAAARVLANEAVEDVKRRIRTAMDDAFAFVGDGQFVTTISDGFELDTEDGKGRPAGLSEGQKMVRAYIFSVVLRQIVGYQFPLLVDTPLGRLDSRNSREAASLLSNFVASDSENRGIQIIMSMHDMEYTPYVRQYFQHVKPQELYFYDEVPTKRSVVGEGIHTSWTTPPGSWKDWFDGKVAQE